MKRLLLALAAIFLSSIVPITAEASTPAYNFQSGNIVTLYVRSGGSDSYDGLSATATSSTRGPYPSIASALAQIPNGYLATVVIDLGSATYALPDTLFTPIPGSARISSVHTVGSVIIRGACTSVKTWTTSVTWSLVSSRVSQVTGNVGSFTGTVTDGSHFIRSGSGTAASPYAYKISSASTTPNLRTVDFSTTAYAGTLCDYGTTISGDTTFAAVMGPEGSPQVVFEGVSFSGSPTLRGVKLKGSKIATPSTSATGMVDVQLQASSLGAAATLVSRTGNVGDIQLSMLSGCTKLLGHWHRVSGVVDATCTDVHQKGQLQIGSVGLGFDGGVSDAPDELSFVDQIESLDIEGNGTCLALVSGRARLGGGAATDDMTCNPSASGGVLNARANSRFGIFDQRSTVTGNPKGRSVVREGSVVGPLYGGFIVQDAGFTVGSRDAGAGAALLYPGTVSGTGAVDAEEQCRVFQNPAP